MQEKEPWIKAKQTDAEGKVAEEAQVLIDNCLHICLQLCANLAIYINPFLPNTARKMCGMMKVVDKMLDWENAGKTKLLSVGYSLRAPELLFRKIEDAEVAYQVEKLKKGLQKSMEANNKVDGGQMTDDSKQPAATAAGPTTGSANRRSSKNRNCIRRFWQTGLAHWHHYRC